MARDANRSTRITAPRATGRRALLAALFAGALLPYACAGAPPPPPPARETGVRGVMTLGPRCPVEREGPPCADSPYQGRLAIEIAGGGRRVYEGLAGADGRFSVPLAPGHYRIIASPPETAIFPRAEPIEVNVPDDGFVDVRVPFESGIR